MHLLWHLLRLVQLLLVQVLALSLLGRASTGRELLFRDGLCVASSHGFSQGRRHLTRRKSGVIGCRLVFVSELILMTCYLLTLGQCWILVFGLSRITHHVSWRVLWHSLMSCVRDVSEVVTRLSLSLVIGCRVRASLWILRIMGFWLYDESGHVVLNVLLHQEVIIAVIVN